MKPPGDETLKRCLERILALESKDRNAALEELRSRQPDLAREVMSLLEFDEVEALWSESPLFSLSRPDPGHRLAVGRRIGPYRIVQKLGEGGMGSVARAVREGDFELEVAIKTLGAGVTAGSATRRFRRERRLLALLDHPNIARILDGGETEEGTPFFVLEFVDGSPIDVHVARSQLSLRARIELFLKVCSAVSSAHEHLVIHRDLKPANVLVDRDGEPKVLDFGIAKLIDSGVVGDDLTSDHQLPMTLRYASPEQLRGEELTTRSDIYSLGVVLFEVLTETHPFAESGDDALALVEAIGGPRPLPSKVAGSSDLAGDLDSIVLKAMAPLAGDRYRTVDELASDLERHLEGLPVRAREATVAYRLSRFAARHRAALLALGAFLVLLMSTTAATTILWRRAVEQRSLADAARARSDTALEFTKDLFWNSLEAPGVEGQPQAMDLLRRAEEALNDEGGDPLVRADLLGSVGQALVRLGRLEEARRPIDKAEQLLRAEYPEDHPELTEVLSNRASLYFRLGRYREAEPLYRDVLARRQALGTSNPCDPRLVKAWGNMALILATQGEVREPERLYLRALACRRSSESPDSPVLARSLLGLGSLYRQSGELEESERLLREALRIRRANFPADDPRVASALSALGRLLLQKGDSGEASEVLEESLRVRRAELGADHTSTALGELDLAELYLETDRQETGEELVTGALASLESRHAPDSWEIARARSLLARCLAAKGETAEATRLLRVAHATLSRVRGAKAPYTVEAENALLALGEFPAAGSAR